MTRGTKGVRTWALDTSPLRDSVPYRALWLGQIVSLMGTQMRIVALAWQVFLITDSNVAVGLIGLVEVVPLIVFSIVGGSIADTYDRRALVLRAQFGSLLVSALLAVVSFGSPRLWVLYALAAVGSALNGIDRPARHAMVPALVGEERLSAAMALRQVVFQVTQIVGPAVGGLMIASLDLGWVYVVDAATFLAAIAAMRWVPATPPRAGEPKARMESIKEGLSFSFRTPLILSIFVIDLVAMIFGMPRAVFPALAERTFEIGAAGVGLLYAAPSVGALVGALTSGWVVNVRRQGVAVLVSVTLWGLFITLAGLSLFSLALTLTFLAFAGAADVISAVFRGTMLQQVTPDELRGRASSVNIMVVTGGPRLGDVEAGLVAGAVGAPASVVIGGVACLVGTGAVAAAFPSLRKYRAGSAAPPAPD